MKSSGGIPGAILVLAGCVLLASTKEAWLVIYGLTLNVIGIFMMIRMGQRVKSLASEIKEEADRQNKT